MNWCQENVTTLRLVSPSDPGSGTRHYWAIGHLVGSGGSLMDRFEVSDLTIDCNLSGQTGSAVACGGVRIMGNHARVRRVLVKDWGTKTADQACVAIAGLTADPSWEIEEDEPAATSDAAP